MGRRAWIAGLIVTLPVIAVTAFDVGRTTSDDAAVAPEIPSSDLPRCDSLEGRALGSFDEGSGWGGCVTPAGAAVQSYRYLCSGLSEVLPPDGNERTLADEAPVVLLPDADLLGVAGGEWRSSDFSGAYSRTPFSMLTPYRCEELRALPHEGLPQARCDVDEHEVDLFTTQGCRSDEGSRAAVGRLCEYFDYDITARWEQWWIEDLASDYGNGPLVMESHPDGRWALTPEGNRDDRCSTHPDEWSPQWREADS